MESYYSPKKVRKLLEKYWLLEEGIKPRMPFDSDEGRSGKDYFDSPYEEAIILKCDIDRAIGLLPALKKQAVVLRYIHLYRHGQIKGALKLGSTKEVDNLLARARVDMAKILGWRPPQK